MGAACDRRDHAAVGRPPSGSAATGDDAERRRMAAQPGDEGLASVWREGRGGDAELLWNGAPKPARGTAQGWRVTGKPGVRLRAVCARGAGKSPDGGSKGGAWSFVMA